MWKFALLTLFNANPTLYFHALEFDIDIAQVAQNPPNYLENR